MNYPTYPMGYESYYLFIRGDDSTITIDSSTLNGKKIGTIPGLLEKSIREWVDNNNIIAEIVVYNDVHDREAALSVGEIDAFIGESASVSSKDNIVSLLKIKNVDMYLCVAKERLDLLQDLNLAQENLNSKEPYYINDLSKKYFSKNAISLQVAADEKKWLEMHDYTITIGYMDNFLPYCGTDENGNATGIMVDLINEAFSNIKSEKPIRFEYHPYHSTEDMIRAIHSHEIEILFPISNDIYFLEQNNLYHSVDVITSAMNLVYRGNPAEAEQGILAINENNQIQYNYAANYFPDNEIIYFDTAEKCLDAVAKGEANGTILSGLRASVLLKEDDYSELSYMELPHNTEKCFGVSTAHKGILPLLNQALNSTGGDEYYGLLQADISEYEAAKKQLDELSDNWRGTYSSSLKIAVGAATLKDVDSRQVIDLCKYADKCMYQAKSDWYNSSGINRRVN